MKPEWCLGWARFPGAPPGGGCLAQSCQGLRPPGRPLCLRRRPPQLGVLGGLAQQQEAGQAAGPLGQDSLGRARVWSLVRTAYAPGESEGNSAGGGQEGGPPSCWVNMSVQACLGTSLCYIGARQHFKELGVARFQPEGDREGHLRISTDLT